MADSEGGGACGTHVLNARGEETRNLTISPFKIYNNILQGKTISSPTIAEPLPLSFKDVQEGQKTVESLQ